MPKNVLITQKLARHLQGNEGLYLLLSVKRMQVQAESLNMKNEYLCYISDLISWNSG